MIKKNKYNEQIFVENYQNQMQKTSKINKQSQKTIIKLTQRKLSHNQVKLLLSFSYDDNKKKHQKCFSSMNWEQKQIQKQQLLQTKRLFDPFAYFGFPQFKDYRSSVNFHQKKLKQMLSKSEQKVLNNLSKEKQYRKNIDVQVILKEKQKILQKINEKNTHKQKRSLKRCSSKLTVRLSDISIERKSSLKKKIRQDKQNYVSWHNNINNMQKVRLKLKLSKK